MSINLSTIEYLAFEGGGGMGLAYVGSLAALRDAYQDQNISTTDEMGRFQWPVKGISGSSAGAINALMMALDYTPEETSNLIVRDGLFARLFSEKIKLQYHRGVVSTHDGTTSGWYGNQTRHANKAGGLANINDLLKACCPQIKDVKQETPTEKTRSKKTILEHVQTLEMFKNKLENSPEKIKKVMLEAMEFFNIPTSLIEVMQILIGILINSGIRYLVSGEKLDNTEATERFVVILNDEATKKLNTIDPSWVLKLTNPKWSIGSSSPSGFKFWGMLFAYPVALLPVIFYLLVSRGPVKENHRKDEIRGRRDLGRMATTETKRIVGKNNSNYMIGLLSRIWWNNIFNPALKRTILRQVITPSNVKQIFILLAGSGYKNLSAEDLKEQQKKALKGLQKSGVSLIALFLKAPITEIAGSALINDGGLLQGDVTREILTTIVFNKYFVTYDENGKDWLLVKRVEALETTLSRVADDAVSLIDIATVIANSQLKSPQPLTAEKNKALREKALQKTAVNENNAVRDKLLKKITEYESLLYQLADSMDKIDKETMKKGLDSKAMLEKKIVKLRAMAEMHNLTGRQILMSVSEQINKIETGLTFAKLFEATKKDLVITGTNMTASQPVFFRVALTPDFPVLDAVSISASFPFLFRPTAVCYRGPSGAFAGRGREPAFYAKHYSGYFIDGGVFNNLPMNAFNGVQDSGLTGTARFGPQQMLFEKFQNNVLAFELTNEADDKPCVFAEGYANGEKHRKLATVLNNGLMGSFYAMGGPLQRAQAGMDELVIKVAPGNLGLFDMVPDYPAIADMFAFNYDMTFKCISGKDSNNKGSVAAFETMGDLYKTASADSGEIKKADRAKKAWNNSRKMREALMQDLLNR